MISHIQMEYLLAVARTGNITKAAQQLHISQPSLSNQIIALEKQLGIPLLERRRKRIYLTDAGLYFANQSYKLLTQSRNLEYAMKEFSRLQNGSLRVGLLPILCPLQLLEKLDSDDLDAVLAILEEKDLEKDISFLPFKTSPICAALHESHPLAGFSALTAEQLTRETLILSSDSFVLQQIILENIKAGNTPPANSMKCSQIESCLALADKNMGIAFCSPEVADYYHFPHIVLRPLNPPITRCVYLAYKKNPNYFPLLKAFVQHIQGLAE